MAANKRKILESARKQAQKGAKEKALKEYQRLLKLDPRDAKLRLEIGDTYRRWGQVAEAIETYTKVADQYMKEGFDARAVAVFKQILNLDPDRHASYVPLAELYERMGLAAEAIQALQTAADGFHRDGQKREALDLLRKMATIDPTNTTSRTKVAELLRQEDMLDEAVSEYAQVAEELERQGDIEAAAKVYRRILEIEPDRVPTLASLARNLLGRGKAKEAEPFAKSAMATDPDEPDHYELLADVYRGQNRDDLLPEVYRPLADLYRRRGDDERARDIVQRFIPPSAIAMDPGDADEEMETLDDDEFLDDEGADVSDPNQAFFGGGALGDSILPKDDAEPELLELETPVSPDVGAVPEIEIDLPPAAVDPEPARPETLEETAAPASVVEETAEPVPAPIGDPEQLLAEASVYLRYGKRDKAIVHLEAILAADPAHRPALEKLGEAHAEGGEPERAVECWLQAAKHAREDGDDDAIAVLRGRVAALDAAAAATLDPPAPPPAESPAPPPAESAADDVDLDDEIDLDLDLDLDDAPDASVGATAAQDPNEHSIQIEDEIVFEDEIPETEPPVPAAPADAPAGSSLSGNSLSTATTEQILEDLEEADFYMQQGLHNEAEEIYKRVLSVAPNHPRALVRLGEVAAARGEDPGTSGTGLTAAVGAEPTDAAPPTAPAAALESEAATPDEPAPVADDADDLPDVTVDEPALSDEEVAGDFEDLDLGLDEESAAEAPPASEEPAVAEGEGGDTEEIALEESDDSTGQVGIADARAEVQDAAREAAPAAKAPPAAATTPEVPSDDGGFDLAAALSDAFDDDPDGSTFGSPGETTDDGFEAVFDAFKKGVSETLGDADHEAHYDLGIAYKEMGLLDDAVSEFRVAMGSEAHREQCLQLLGLCAIDAGQPGQAVGHLNELLSLPNLRDEQTLAARFDLGRAHEALGQRDLARSAWEAVAAIDDRFCEVGERLAALDRPDAAADDGEDDDDADFESFEDVILEAEDEDDEADEPDADDEPAEADPGETFQDLVAEANADDEAPEIDDEDAPESAADPESEPELESEPAAAAEPAAPTSARRRKKKKISFV